MRFFFFSIIFLSISLFVNAQENSPFTTGFEETISSKILSHQRKIWIHIPNSNGGTKIKNKGKYPVMIW